MQIIPLLHMGAITYKNIFLHNNYLKQHPNGCCFLFVFLKKFLHISVETVDFLFYKNLLGFFKKFFSHMSLEKCDLFF